ncbi:exopolysaccharide biosynthesis polyprenyl glycosylphosphotransferase [Exiguobacterium sp. s21]|uniref:exopolysaccharide biosynthesis polyprenyl glycosylphosphotransferase n=1 Tax=Exiguobacterium sp. s21 TaxID=2751244 RepID=UPI001BE75737|nr:exopolysaccharide biosynthesis polyprenyl glycosylphosphotransferase [Exiguobacterium sp. s21]
MDFSLKSDETTINLPNKSHLMFKRVFDILISIILMLITLPILFVVAILIYLESPGNVIYKQKRMGYNNNEFWIYKLRSMKLDAEKNGARWAMPNDLRITKVGKFIRSTRIDELPQLFNVIIGDMSLIGPRPERKVFIDEFTKELPEFKYRTVVRPGLTGWAQVNGGYDLSIESKLDKDLYYINNYSIKLELLIIVKTIRVIFTGEGAR